MDKFKEYYEKDHDRISELSEYVHKNFHLILTKMISEMRRKLDITPDLINSDGYISLMVTLYGRVFNEMIYGLSAYCQSFQLDIKQIVAPSTIHILIQLMKGENPLNGLPRTDVRQIPKEERDAYYLKYIDELRSHLDCLPK